MEQLIQTDELFVYDNQVSGKSPKYTGKDPSIIYKFYTDSEHNFYTFLQKLTINDQGYSLKKFLPAYHGVVHGSITIKNNENQQQHDKKKWIDMILAKTYEENMKFIKMKNFIYEFKFANILDIKLGTKRHKPSNIKFKESTTNSKKFRMNGMCVRQLKQNQQFHDYFINKYYGQTVGQADIELNLAFFFYSKGIIQKKLVLNFSEEVGKLLLSLQKFPRIRFMSASIILSYDAYNHNRIVVKLIDFDKYQQLPQEQTADWNVIEGVANIQNYLRRISQKTEQHQAQIRQKKLRLFEWDEKATKEQIKKKKINSENNII